MQIPLSLKPAPPVAFFSVDDNTILSVAKAKNLGTILTPLSYMPHFISQQFLSAPPPKYTQNSLYFPHHHQGASLEVQMVKKNPSAVQETQVRSLGQEDPLPTGYPPPVLLPGEFHGQRSLAVYSTSGRKEPDMTEQHTHPSPTPGSKPPPPFSWVTALTSS